MEPYSWHLQARFWLDMAGKQQSVQQDENVAAVLADMPVTPSTSATSPPFRTCSKCQRLFKNTGNTSLHSTLAYSRCRCHRYFKLSLQRHQFGLSHARQLGTQDTFSNGGASATHQNLGGNKISLDYKEHSETIAAIHSNSDKVVMQHTTLPPITHHQKSVVGFSSASGRPTNKQSKKDLLHRTSFCNSSPEASTSRLPALGWWVNIHCTCCFSWCKSTAFRTLWQVNFVCYKHVIYGPLAHAIL